MASPSGRDRDWIGRVALTIVVGCGVSGTILCVSNALSATDHIVHMDSALAELSHFVADGHASIRGRVTTLESIDDVVAAFDRGVERRIARIRSLNIVPGHQVSGIWWTRQLMDHLDVRRIEEECRVYLTAATTTAATTTAATAADDRAMSLRRFALHAQKLIQTVEAARDSAESARARALADADEMVGLASGIGGLVIAYLVWLPVFGGVRLSAGAVVHPDDANEPNSDNLLNFRHATR